MDAIGLAYWESPTHVKCVSKEYQDIQTLVSLPDRFLCTDNMNIITQMV